MVHLAGLCPRDDGGRAAADDERTKMREMKTVNRISLYFHEFFFAVENCKLERKLVFKIGE